MADEMVQEQSASLEFPPDWPAPVVDAYNRLFAYDVEALEGGARFGDLAFTELKPLVDRIRQLAWDLTMESWQDLPDSLVDDQLLANVNAVNETLEQIGAFDLNQAEPANARNALIQSLAGQAGWFKNNVRPHTLKAHGERAALDVAGTDGAASEAAAVREELATLRGQADQVGRELAAREDLVEGRPKSRWRVGERRSCGRVRKPRKEARRTGEDLAYCLVRQWGGGDRWGAHHLRADPSP